MLLGELLTSGSTVGDALQGFAVHNVLRDLMGLPLGTHLADWKYNHPTLAQLNGAIVDLLPTSANNGAPFVTKAAYKLLYSRGVVLDFSKEVACALAAKGVLGGISSIHHLNWTWISYDDNMAQGDTVPGT